MVLAGHKPDVIMEIASRGLSFWTYQIGMDRSNLRIQIEKTKEKQLEMQKYFEDIKMTLQNEILSYYLF